MSAAIFIIVSLVLILFAFVIAFGAPYLPTLSPQIDEAFTLLKLKKGEVLIELGCGDGRVLVAAAERGYNVVGYELNPLLALLSWARTRKYGKQVRVIWGNFWTKTWPPTDGIFVFLLDKYMEKLDKKITQNYKTKTVKLVSFAFAIPGKEKSSESTGMYLYRYN